MIIRVVLIEFTIFDSLVENIHPKSEIETTLSKMSQNRVTKKKLCFFSITYSFISWKGG